MKANLRPHFFLVSLLLFGVTNPIPAQDGGDVPDLPSQPFDYVGYADENLPPHFRVRTRGNIPRTNNTPADNPLTNAGATLGRVLFYDMRLSEKDNISCASCHRQENGFSDPRIVSVSTDGLFTDRHSMGLSNLRYYKNDRYRWGEDAPDLIVQSFVPIQHPFEMSLPLSQMIPKVENAGFYQPLFEDAFGDDEITVERVSKALSQFMRAMVSYRSKFDQAFSRHGVPKFEKLFDRAEMEGLRLFGGNPGVGRELHCFQCHETDAQLMRNPRNNGLDATTTDVGAGDAKFKAPSLRNIAVRDGFMHDGRFKTLEEVVDFYDQGVQPHPNLDPVLKAEDGSPLRLNLNPQEKQSLIAFLRTLTDPEFLTNEIFSSPFPLPIPEVRSIQINDGEAQRSSVEILTIEMEGIIDFTEDAFEFTQLTDRNGATNLPIDFVLEHRVTNGDSIFEFRFPDIGRNPLGSITDGNYQLKIHANRVQRDGYGMTEDFYFGMDPADKFFAFYGDTDGDRDVDDDDAERFWIAYLTSAGQPDYDMNLDYDLEGNIRELERDEFLDRLGTDIDFD